MHFGIMCTLMCHVYTQQRLYADRNVLCSNTIPYIQLHCVCGAKTIGDFSFRQYSNAIFSLILSNYVGLIRITYVIYLNLLRWKNPRFLCTFSGWSSTSIFQHFFSGICYTYTHVWHATYFWVGQARTGCPIKNDTLTFCVMIFE